LVRTSSTGTSKTYGGGAQIADWSNERGTIVNSNFSNNVLIAQSASTGNSIEFRGGGLQLFGDVEMNNTRFVGNLVALTGQWASTSEALGGGCSTAGGIFYGTNLQFLNNRVLSCTTAMGGGYGMSRSTYMNTRSSADIESAMAIGNTARGLRVSGAWVSVVEHHRLSW
jgi:hypothetical protein